MSFGINNNLNLINMKRNFKLNSFALIILMAILLSSCNPQPKGESTTTKYGDYAIKVIDSCEYIEFDYGIVDQRVYSLTHKGNCKFCKIRKSK